MVSLAMTASPFEYQAASQCTFRYIRSVLRSSVSQCYFSRWQCPPNLLSALLIGLTSRPQYSESLTCASLYLDHGKSVSCFKEWHGMLCGDLLTSQQNDKTINSQQSMWCTSLVTVLIKSTNSSCIDFTGGKSTFAFTISFALTSHSCVLGYRYHLKSRGLFLACMLVFAGFARARRAGINHVHLERHF